MTAVKSGAELVAGALAHFGSAGDIATTGVSAHTGDTAGAALGAANALQGMASLGGKLAGSLGVVGPLAVANIGYAASLIAKDRRIKTCARWDVDGEEKVHGLVLQLFYEFRVGGRHAERNVILNCAWLTQSLLTLHIVGPTSIIARFDSPWSYRPVWVLLASPSVAGGC